MVNTVIIVGRVVEVVPDRDAINVIVRTGSGTKRAGGEWTEDAACRFWGDAKKYTDVCTPGVLVRIDASAKSRKGDRGYFTSVEARYAQVIGSGAQGQQAAGKVEPPKLWNEPKADDSDVPF